MSTVMQVTYDNTRITEMTDYQKLVYFYLLGRLSLEWSGFVQEKTVVDVIGNPDRHVTVKFHGVNVNLIAGYIKSFPFKTEDLLVDDVSADGSPAVSVTLPARYILNKSIVVQTIEFPIHKSDK